jgi:dihydrofolate reductase
MRSLIVSSIMSLDGLFTGPDDNIMVMPMDPAFNEHNLARLRAADTLLLGRSTYEGFREYWPSIVDNLGADPTNQAIARRNDVIEKVVVSDSLRADPSQPWADTTRIVPRARAYEEIAALKAGEGGDILMFGSQVLWLDLLAHGLVDELHVILGASVIGGGRPMFGDFPVRLARLGVDVPSGSENVIVRYRVVS